MTPGSIAPIALAALLLAACRLEQQTGAPTKTSPGATRRVATRVEPGFNLFRPEQDVEIGRLSAQQVESQLPLVDSPEVNAFVKRVGERLARNAPGYRFPYEFRVVNASELNAFALPGGTVFINRGVLQVSKNEGEVAGVLAHEIAHVALRHGTHQASRAYIAQAGVGLLGGIFGGHIIRGAASMIDLVGGFGLNALFLKYSRTAESEADVEGSQILAKSGYNPADMISFFRTLETVDKSRTINFFSDHPSPEGRMERIEKEAKLLRVDSSAATDPAQFQALQAQLMTMAPAKSTREVARMSGPPETRKPRPQIRIRVPNVSPPSPEMKAYTSPDGLFRIAYPANWKVHEGGSGATFAPDGGAGEIDGATEIVYGAVASYYDPIGDQAAQKRVHGGVITMQDATDDLLAQIGQSSPHLQLAERGKQFRIPGGDVLGSALIGDNPRTGLRERVTVIAHGLPDQHLFFLIFVTPESASQTYGPVFSAMLNSLKVNDRHGV